MILFKPEHVQPIIEGRKTQTRRLGKRRWNVGKERQCRTSMFGDPFAIVRILNVRSEELGCISAADVYAEGYDSLDAYMDVWKRINGEWDQSLVVWVIDFELVTAFGRKEASNGKR